MIPSAEGRGAIDSLQCPALTGGEGGALGAGPEIPRMPFSIRLEKKGKKKRRGAFAGSPQKKKKAGAGAGWPRF